MQKLYDFLIQNNYMKIINMTYNIFYCLISISPLKKERKKQYAFTLAEVLITLAVIGVVAAMSVPSMINSTKTAELRTGLNTGYSILSQGVKKMAQEEGGQLLKTYNGKANQFKPQFMKYFNVQKDCGTHSCVAVPWPSDVYKTYSKKPNLRPDMFDEGQFLLSNSMIVFFQNSDDTGRGITISIDVNGYKKPPNAWGHDLFTFRLMDNDTLLPLGTSATGYAPEADYCSASSDNMYNGVGCTTKALRDPDYWKNLPR